MNAPLVYALFPKISYIESACYLYIASDCPNIVTYTRFVLVIMMQHAYNEL